MTEAAGIHLERDGAIATLIIDNPGRRNAITQAMWTALPIAVQQAEDDPAVRVLIVRGAQGDFSAGADITEFEDMFGTTERARAYMAHFAKAQEALAACTKPTVAAIAGACVGGGCALTMACDVRFAGEDVRMGVTPTKLGMIYSFADTRRLVQAVGYANAMDLLFSGRLVRAAECLQLGLVNRVVPSGDIHQKTLDYAAQLSANAPGALKATKQVMGLIKSGDDDGAQKADRLFFDILSGPDFLEGREAFLAGRPPRFG